jgi:hypothetical protein
VLDLNGFACQTFRETDIFALKEHQKTGYSACVDVNAVEKVGERQRSLRKSLSMTEVHVCREPNGVWCITGFGDWVTRSAAHE